MKIQMTRKFSMYAILLVYSLTVFYILYSNQSHKTWYGYVVGENRKIYMINLDSGIVEWTSRVIEEMGKSDGEVQVSSIEINSDESILYVGREASLNWRDFVPLVAVKLNQTADIIFDIPFSYDPEIIDDVMGIRLNPNGRFLYVNFLGSEPSYILDPIDGEIIGSIDRTFPKRVEFSPDGKMIALIYPEGSYLRESGLVDYEGLVSGSNLETMEGYLTYLVENRGLYPPWGSTEDHFVYVRSQPRQEIYRLEVYNRESGELIAYFDEFPESVKLEPNQRHPTHIPSTDLVAMTAGNEVFVFNGKTAEVVKRIHVADVRLTEVVVTDKPLIRSDSH